MALSEAHDSGACAWARERKRAFAQDLDNLTLASPRVNRYEKGAKDHADWMPAHNGCWYANQVRAVKEKGGLAMDADEHRAIKRMRVACHYFRMLRPS